MLNFRNAMGPDFPVSFSAGVDQNNFTDAVCCAMVPVTTCTDLLAKGGYTRAVKYLRNLESAMIKAGVTDIPGLISSRTGLEGSAGETGLAFAQAHVPGLIGQERYYHAKNRTSPKKVSSFLSTFDCLTCNICLPVCPNAANFSLPIGKQAISYNQFVFTEGNFHPQAELELNLEKPAQIANLADFCNECANCEVFCPELGGPQNAKPRFFNTRESFDLAPDHKGYYFKDGHTMVGRFGDLEISLSLDADKNQWLYHHPHFGEMLLDESNQLCEGRPLDDLAEGEEVDMEPFIEMKTLFKGVLASGDYATTLMKP